MDYHLNRKGEELGVFTLPQIRAKRRAGELDGTELLWCRGMKEWQRVDAILGEAPVPGRNRRLVLFGVTGSALLAAMLFFGVFFTVGKVRQEVRRFQETFLQISHHGDRGVELAAPLDVSPDTRAHHDMLPGNREFRLRHVVMPHAARSTEEPCHELGQRYLAAWLFHHFQGEPTGDSLTFSELGEKISHSGDCVDPVVLTARALHLTDQGEKTRLLRQAVDAFENSDHNPWVKFWAACSLAREVDDNQQRGALEARAVAWFRDGLRDGYFTEEDQPFLAEVFVHNWGRNLFRRRGSQVTAAVEAVEGDELAWLKLVLRGHYETRLAWRSRGGGDAHTVTEEGHAGFRQHLGNARQAYTAAWELDPTQPLPAARMIEVCMGKSDREGMRLWFERALDVQVDYEPAWARMRWALRPRWFGSHESLIALGAAAVETGRFDTDTPRKLFDCVTNIESELNLEPGEHIYGRENIWPLLQTMYKGYIAEPTQEASRDGWRSSYAAVAYFAGEYATAREQLEALGWEPWWSNFDWWNVDLSLMPLEVAARTGSHAEQIARAEEARKGNNPGRAARAYRQIANDRPDEKTAEYVRRRLAELEAG